MTLWPLKGALHGGTQSSLVYHMKLCFHTPMTRRGLQTKAALFHPMPRPGCAHPLRFEGRMRMRLRRGVLARTVNGLLVTGNSADAHTYYNADGNGNVTCLLNSKQAVVGRYLYDSYGNTLSLSGPQAEANPYRFSSKECHYNAELYYWGCRLLTKRRCTGSSSTYIHAFEVYEAS